MVTPIALGTAADVVQNSCFRRAIASPKATNGVVLFQPTGPMWPHCKHMRNQYESALGARGSSAKQPASAKFKRRVVQYSTETGVPNVAEALARKLKAKGVIAFTANASANTWDPLGTNLIDRHDELIARDLTAVR